MCTRCKLPWIDHQFPPPPGHEVEHPDDGPTRAIVAEWTTHAPTQHYIDSLAGDIAQWAQDKGFWDVPTSIRLHMSSSVDVHEYVTRLIKSQKLMLMVTEIVEGFEAIRQNADAPSEHIGEFTAEEEEIADTIIRLLDYAGHHRLRLGAAIDAKMVFNTRRPHKHGKRF
jgi:NTP pyrophosphatase (non-canonical NTP hydrolase)